MTETRSKGNRAKANFILMCVISFVILVSLTVPSYKAYAKKNDTIVLKIGSWEEYIDQGGWDDNATIKLGNKKITSKKGLIADFEDWYYTTYGRHVKVEYSTFGTNEDLYSKLVLGESYDLVCPSEYMFSRLMKENRLQPLSKDFFKKSSKYNYYAKGVSPFISGIFKRNKIDGASWSAYAAGYMWGTMGIVYNPKLVDEKDAATWSILINPKYAKRLTIKDSVREAYFPTMAIINEKLLLSNEFKNKPDYWHNLASVMNNTSDKSIAKEEEMLHRIRENVYSFETDSGKSDMVTGKILANVQWSGDAVYAMDQAEAAGTKLNYSAPIECTNLWLDSWVMLKSGIKGNAVKQQAAQAFINFISRPDNVVRNMSYIGYTSCISGGTDPLVYEYTKYKYEAKDKNETVKYPLGYFFDGNDNDSKYILIASKDQTKRQLFAQYPPKSVIDRSAIMGYFPDKVSSKLNKMWINVRCFNFSQVSKVAWIKTVVILCGIILVIIVFINRYKVFRKPIKSGYYRIS